MPTRVLLLSPHPDDLAWSLGRTVAGLRAAGADRHGVTFFGHTRYAPGDSSHGHRAASAVRAAEEEAWARWAGVRMRRHDLPDASLRGYDDDTELGPEPEPELVAAVAERLRAALAEVEPELVFAPLAIGGHVDHAAVRRAMSEVDCAAEVLWYEDLPYANGTRARPDGHPVVLDTAGYWTELESGVRHYPSQLPQEVLPVLRGHRERVGGERLWASDADAAARLSGLIGSGL